MPRLATRTFLAAILLIVGLASFAAAQSPKAITSTRCFQDEFGNCLANGIVTLTLTRPAQVMGGGQVAPMEAVIALDGTGNIPGGTVIWGTDQLNPNGVAYGVTIAASTGRIVSRPGFWGIAGSAPIDLAQETPVSVNYSFPNVVGWSGSITPGDCAQWITSTFIGDAGAPCGSGGGSSNWSALIAGTNSHSGSFIASGNAWDFSAASSFKFKVGAGSTITNAGATGQVPLSNGDGTFSVGDPIVSGATAIGAAPSTNPVFISTWDGVNIRVPLTTNSTPSGSDYALEVRNIPSGTQAVSGSVSLTGTLPAFASTPAFTISGTLPAFAATPTVNAAQSGTWTVQQGGAPWSITGSGNFTVVQATGTNLHMVCDSGCSSSAGFADNGVFTVGTTAINPLGGYYTSGADPTLSTGNEARARMDSHSYLFSDLTAMAGTVLGAPSTYGTSPGAVEVLGVNAFITNVPAVSQSGNWTTRVVGNAGGIFDAVQNAAAPANGLAAAGVYNSSLPTITSGNLSQIQVDAKGQVLTDYNYVAGAAVSTAATGIPKVGITDSAGASVTLGQKTMANSLPIVPASDYSPSDTVGVQGTLGAANNTATVAVNGQQGTGVLFSTGLVGTVVPEISMDGGTTWSASFFVDPITAQSAASLVNPGAAQKNIWIPGGTSNARVRVSAYTSGSATATLRATLAASDSIFSAIGPNAPGTIAANSLLVAMVYNSGAPSPSNGQQLPFQSDSSGRLIVSCGSGCGGSGGTSLADEGSFTQGTTAFTPIGGYFNTSITNLTSGQGGAAQLTNTRHLMVNVADALPAGANTIGAVTQASGPWTVSGTLSNNNAAPTTNNLGALVALVGSSAPSWTNGDQSLLSVDLSGNLRVSLTGTNAISGTVTANQGTSPWVDSCTAANCSVNVGQFGGTNVVTGTGASGAGIPRVTVSNDSNILATQSGTWTIQPGNTANTTPWLATINQGGNSATVNASGQLTVNCAAGCSTASFTGTFNTPPNWAAPLAPISLANGGTAPLQLDSYGRLITIDANDGAILQALQQSPIRNAQRILGTFNRPITSTGDAIDVNVKFATGLRSQELARPVLANGLSTTVTTVYAGPTVMDGYFCYNPNATPAYVQIFDSAGTVTLGTTKPVWSIGLSATSPGNLSEMNLLLQNGFQVAATTTATGNTAPSTAVDCNFATSQ